MLIINSSKFLKPYFNFTEMEGDSNGPSPKKEVECKPDDASVTKAHVDLDKTTLLSDSDVFEEDISANELVLNKSLIDSNLNIKMPRMNVREKIIICLDLCADNDNDSTPFRYIHNKRSSHKYYKTAFCCDFRFGDGTKQTPLAMLKRVIQMYLYCKMTIDTKHQYALMVLHESGASWLVDFTMDPVVITNTLSTLKSRDQPPECDLGQMFDMVADKVVLPHVNDPVTELPPHVVRVIFLYAR